MSHPLTDQYPMSVDELFQLENDRVNCIRDIVQACSNQLARESGRKMTDVVINKVSVGDYVIWHEADGTACKAIVTAVWSQTCINVVIVSPDETKQDNYGRQIERRTSCGYKNQNNVHGFYWRFPVDEANPYKRPEQI